MRKEDSVILARKIIEASEGYLIIPNWKPENYQDNVEGLIEEATSLVARDLKNNGAKPVDEKIDMLDDYTSTIEGVLEDFHEDHKVDVLPYKRQLREKMDSFAFEVKK